MSHTHSDKPIVERVKTALESAGVSTWYDDERIRLGDLLSDTIQQGIDDSVFVAVFISKKSVVSDWVRREVRAAQKEVERMQKKYIPIMVEDVEPTELPLYLRDRVWADLRRGSDDQIDNVTRKIIKTIAAFENNRMGTT